MDPTEEPRSKCRVTLADVARHAGVSRATASLVVRDAGSISAATRARVRSSMAELGYLYHRGAAALRSSQSKTVGFVIPDPSNAFMAEMTLGLESVLLERDFLTMTVNTLEDPDRQQRLVRALLERQVDGLVVLPALDTGALAEVLSGIPAVVAIRSVDEPSSSASYVGIDNVKGGELAAAHLLGHGCRTFAYLGGLASLGPRRERLLGVRRALAGTTGRLIAHRSGPATGAWSRQATERLLAAGVVPDAVVCHNDAVAFGVCRSLRDLAPDAVVRVIGFDNVDEAELWEPPISSVTASGRDVGREAARALLRRIDDSAAPAERVLLDPELIVRQSCGCPDGRSDHTGQARDHR